MDRATTWIPTRLGRWAVGACLVAGAFVLAAVPGSTAATSGSVVGATVPSSITLDQTGCDGAASREFGAVPVSTSVLTAPCTIQFESSNDSSMLRLVRRSKDGAQPTMARADWSFSVQRAATGSALQDIDAYSVDVAWAVGNGGTILATTDGGSTWSPQASGTAQDLHRIDVVDASTAWVVGQFGTVLRTVNGGTTWTATPQPSGANLRDVHAIDADEAWVSGDSGSIYRTLDGGATWTSLGGAMAGNVHGLAVLSQSVAVAVTSSPREIWRSADAGASWSLVSNTGDCNGWKSVDAASPTVVYVGGCGNNLGVSTDAGATWTIRLDGWNEGDDVEAISPQVAYFSDTGGGIDRTYDGLATLPFHPNSIAGFIGTVTGLAVPEVDSIWFSGSDGSIWRSDPSPGISDYSGSTNWSSGGATSTFGVCVESVGATTIPVWAADTTGISGTCETNDTDTWRAVPATPTKVAEAATGDPGSIDVVWGMRTSATQASGRYFAPVVWEAIAPSA